MGAFTLKKKLKTANASCFVLLGDGSLASGAVAEYRTFNARSKFDAVCKVADYYNIVGLDDIKDDELGFDDVCGILRTGYGSKNKHVK